MVDYFIPVPTAVRAPVASDYTPTHYAAPYTEAADSPANDDIDQGANAWSNATSSGSPVTIQTAINRARAGDVVQFAPGVYASTATVGVDTLIPHWLPAYAGTAANPIVFTAQNPAANNSGSPGILSELRQSGYGARTLGNTPDPMIGANTDYVRFDGFFIDEQHTIPADDKGAMNIKGGYNPPPTGCMITRCWARRVFTGSDYEGGMNCAPFWVADAISATVADNLITGDGSVTNDNCGSIMSYRAQNLTIEYNTISGAPGPYPKAEVVAGTQTTNCQVRYNIVHDARTYAFRTSTFREVYLYQNILGLSGASGNCVQFDSKGADSYNCPVWMYNNILINTSTSGTCWFLKADRLFSSGEIHSNIFVTTGTGASFQWKQGNPPTTDIDSMDRFNYNIWHVTHAGDPRWIWDYDGANNTITNFTNVSPQGWQEYMATYGTDLYGDTYEADSSYSDPEFVSANYSDIPSGNWALANNAQDALTGSPSGGECGLDGITPGVRDNPSY